MITYCVALLLAATGASAEYLLAEYAPKHDNYKPAQYHFSYGVSDHTTGDHKHHWETRDGDFVKGEYGLLQPDGVTRIVEYTSDPHHGFQAKVHKIGPSIHPHHEYTSGNPLYGSHGGLYDKHEPQPEVLHHDFNLQYAPVASVDNSQINLGHQLEEAPYHHGEIGDQRHIQLHQPEPFQYHSHAEVPHIQPQQILQHAPISHPIHNLGFESIGHGPQPQLNLEAPKYKLHTFPAEESQLASNHHLGQQTELGSKFYLLASHVPPKYNLPTLFQIEAAHKERGEQQQIQHEVQSKPKPYILPSDKLFIGEANAQVSSHGSVGQVHHQHIPLEQHQPQREHYQNGGHYQQQVYQYAPTEAPAKQIPQYHQPLEIPSEYSKEAPAAQEHPQIDSYFKEAYQPQLKSGGNNLHELFKLIHQTKPGEGLNINPISTEEFHELQAHFQGGKGIEGHQPQGHQPVYQQPSQHQNLQQNYQQQPRVVEVFYPQGEVTMKETVVLGDRTYEQPQLPVKQHIYKRQNAESSKKNNPSDFMTVLKTFWDNITQNQKKGPNNYNGLNSDRKTSPSPKPGDTIWNAGDYSAPRENETLARQLNETCLYLRFNETNKPTEDGTVDNIWNAGDYSAQREPEELIRSINVTCENLADEAIRNITNGLNIYKYCGYCFEAYQNNPPKDEPLKYQIPTTVERPTEEIKKPYQANQGKILQSNPVFSPDIFLRSLSGNFKRSPLRSNIGS